jgi:hypothetical protein
MAAVVSFLISLYLPNCAREDRGERVPVENYSAAAAAGWRVLAHCDRESSRKCGFAEELDLEALVLAHGRAFLLASLAHYLRRPRCGSRDAEEMARQ